MNIRQRNQEEAGGGMKRLRKEGMKQSLLALRWRAHSTFSHVTVSDRHHRETLRVVERGTATTRAVLDLERR